MESKIKKDMPSSNHTQGIVGENYDEVPEYQAPIQDKELLDLYNLLKEVNPDTCPMMSELEAWKSFHRSIYISKVSSEAPEYYVWRTLKRHEFKKLSATNSLDDDEKANEILVEKCVLYPIVSQEWRLISDAGVITTLGKQIAYKSGFVTQQEALSLIKVI